MLTRFRSAPAIALVAIALASVFFSGALAGTAATLLATTAPAPRAEPCSALPDPIGCLILLAQGSQ